MENLVHQLSKENNDSTPNNGQSISNGTNKNRIKYQGRSRHKRCGILSTRTKPSEPIRPSNKGVPGAVVSPPSTQIPEPPAHWRQQNKAFETIRNSSEHAFGNQRHNSDDDILLDYSDDMNTKISSDITFNESKETSLFSTVECENAEVNIGRYRKVNKISSSLTTSTVHISEVSTDITVIIKNRRVSSISQFLLSSNDPTEISFNSWDCPGVCCEIAFNLQPPSDFISS